ncbi:MAG: response regulator, partial [Acidobacteriota bacterium]
MGRKGHTPEKSRILVVDDEPAMLRAVERILERQHRVFCHSSPQEALARAPHQRPHLAIVDVQMSGMDGFDLTRALKQLDPQLRVILMTGSAYGTDEKLIRAIEEQVFYFIHKPFDRTVLRTLVARCLELRRLED